MSLGALQEFSSCSPSLKTRKLLNTFIILCALQNFLIFLCFAKFLNLFMHCKIPLFSFSIKNNAFNNPLLGSQCFTKKVYGLLNLKLKLDKEGIIVPGLFDGNNYRTQSACSIVLKLQVPLQSALLRQQLPTFCLGQWKRDNNSCLPLV